MTSFKVNLTVIGVFVLAATATLILALATLAGRTGPTDDYFTEFGNVAGLKYGSQVLYEGYPIGQVENVEPSQEATGKARFRISISVASGWKIPEDSIARSVAPGLLAAQTIAISAGKSPAMLQPGATIRSGMSASLQDSFSSIAGSVDQLTDRSLVPLVDNLNKQVTVLGQILDHDLHPLAENANKFMKATADHWPSVMQHVDDASSNLDLLFSKERVEALDRLITNLDKTAINLQRVSASMDQLMQASGPDLKTAMRELRFTTEAMGRHSESFAENLDSAALNLQEFSRRLRQNPSLLLRSPDSPDDPVPPFKRKD
jgi:phospholipid/cholesterol/gamma-HCH transport system substrate-binding protein